jgi:uncharacterized protein DUF4376
MAENFPPFAPADAYWLVNGNIYHSKRNIYVPSNDADFVARGSFAIPILNEAEIWPQISSYLPAWLWNGTTMSQPSTNQYTVEQLKGYAADARWRKQTGGITVAGVSYLTDRISTNERNVAYNLAQDANITFQWKTPSGFVALTSSQLNSVALNEMNFIQACFAKEQTVGDSIDGGTITTLGQIDAAFDSIPNIFGS